MKNCLVVDDSSVIRKVARRILEGLEFEVAEAEDGEQALEACRRQMPQAVLLDWNMPILLQKSAIRAARPLPRLLGTVLTIRPLMSNDALKGHRPVSRTTQDMHRRLAAVEQPASKAGVNSARLQQG